MKQFNLNMLTCALFTSLASANVAAAEPQDEKNQATEKQIEVIKVGGFRASVVESINTKRFSPELVESISAEDIGKLPDSSIAESIARLPGITAQRLDGRASRVSVRGFSENESATTFNGREQVSIGDSRGVEFDLYPSEIMSGVTVYKTPSASLDAEGIAGVIDMQTVKPLKKSERVVMVNGQYEKNSFDKLNPDGDDSGFRGTLSYIDQFMDDTLGVAVAVNTMSSPNQEKRWNAWGYPEFEGDDGKNYSLLGGAKPFVRSSTLERDSAMLVIQSRPNDKLDMTFDALYVDFSDQKILRGIEIPFGWGQTGAVDPDSVVIDENTGFITQATTEGERLIVRNDHETREAELTQFGFNLEYLLSDFWTMEADVSHSSVERQVWSIESYSGTGRGSANGAADDVTYSFDGGNTGATFTPSLDYSDYALIQLGGPLSWGTSTALNEVYGINDENNPFRNTAQDGFINAPEIEDELNTFKVNFSRALDNDYFSQLHLGMSYRDREKSKVSEGYYLSLKDLSYPDNPYTLEVPEQYRLGTASLDFIGMGEMIAYDTRALIDDGYFSLLAESLSDSKHKTRSWTVQEEVTTAFVQADIYSEIAGIPVSGNLGVRYVQTEQSSNGFVAAVVDGVVEVEDRHLSHDYSHVLPSLNLNFEIDQDQTVRLGLAKTISRARMDDMNASISREYKNTVDENGNNWEITGGNLNLEPKEATGLDLSYENYFSAEGYFSTAIFYKDINQWTFDDNYEEDLTGVVNPATGEVPANPTATRKSKVNGGGGSLWGYELAVTLPFSLFDESLEGIGLIASHTGVEQDIQDHNGNDYELPGLSDKVQSFTLYYEQNGIQARTSMRKRSDFKGEVYGVGFSSEQVDILGETIWDAQLGYDFAYSGIDGLEKLSVTFQIQNLTEEPFTSLNGDNALKVRDYQDYGRTYLLGFSYQL
ncbi:TonB-dependent receptor [Gayadomonas joobiniege]|uniref:TonB-dependent receptor n=1 Tax=Gayadomonas joobiniege TaxID=1234606 RepID=UPI000363C254|nr:TonB-dependent receptor [Gayadomonas joobiniege]